MMLKKKFFFASMRACECVCGSESESVCSGGLECEDR